MKLCKGCMEHYENELTVCPHCGYEENTQPESTLHMIPGALLVDRYLIGKVLGYGGFGVTYIAYDCVLQMKVAVKEYLPSEFATRMAGQSKVTVFGGNKEEQFNDGKEKFVEEAKNLAKFHSCDGIVKIFNTFEANNTAYIVMELLKGETLSSYLEREKKIPCDKAIDMLTPVIKSLQTVHEHSIIHRDIAPDNIFITEKGEVKLIDFGAARYATTSHSRSLTVIIKPGFSPEEQYRSRGDQGPHTDVYAVAATLYKMITGQTPPDALERRAYFEKKNKDILQPIPKYAHDIDINVENAIMNALNVRIEDRTSDMNTFLSELNSDTPVKRRVGKIKKLDVNRWPLWAKISMPAGVLAIVVLMILIVSGTFEKDYEPFVMPDDMTKVPNVVNHDLDTGEDLLENNNLTMRIIDSLYSDEIPENYIVLQNINGGALVMKASDIEVTVSAKVKQIVPNVIGLEAEEAQTQLEDLGFAVKLEEHYDDVVAAGCVIDQSSQAGTELVSGSEITISVSKGKDPNKKTEVKEVELPDFVGMTYDEVVKKAKELGISVKVTDRKYSKEFAKDTVMEQNPKAKTKIMSDKEVELVVSLGYSKVTVPKVVYMTEEKAKSTLTGRGLKVSVTYEYDDTAAAGVVIKQTPAADSSVDPESTVKLVVSKGAAAFEMPNVVGMQQDKAKSTLSSKGLSVTVTYQHNESKTEGEVLSQSVKSGTSVKSGDKVTLTVCTHSNVVSVPNVKGKSRSDAEKELTDKGFVANVYEEYNDDVAEGYVFSQNPESGSLTKGSRVTIGISKGKDKSSVSSAANNPAASSKKEDNGRSSSSQVTTSRTESSSKPSSSNTSSKPSNAQSSSSKATSSKPVSSKPVSSQPVSSRTPSPSSTVSTVVKPTSISLNQSSIELEVNKSGSLSATVSPSNASDKSVSWSSSNTGVVTVDQSGRITAAGEGEAVITASTSNGKTAQCAVKVTPTSFENSTLVANGTCGSDGGNVKWQLYESGTLYIYGSGSMKDNDSSFKDYSDDIATVKIQSGVTSIGSSSFENFTSLKEINIADTVTTLGSGCFSGCSELNEIIIPNSVTEIDDAAFSDCAGLKTVVLSSGMSTVNSSLFINCFSLENITIPDSITSIGDNSFSQCQSLTTLPLPARLQSIGSGAFNNCISLTKLEIPASVTSIGDEAFASCSRVTEIRFKGDKPTFVQNFDGYYPFQEISAEVYYPANNNTWNDIENKWDGGGIIVKFYPYNP